MDSIWLWMTTPPGPGESLNVFGAVYLAIFASAFAISAYFDGPGADQFARNPVQLIGIRHWATIGLWVCGAGLVFFGLRILRINSMSFGEPVWLVVSIVALLVVVIRCVEWWRTGYPVAMARRAADGAVIPLQSLVKIDRESPIAPASPGAAAPTLPST